MSHGASQRGAYRGMRSDPTGTTAASATIAGVRSGIVLDPVLVAALRAVAARADVAHRVLAILEPGGEPIAPPAVPSRR
jgi:hypothetical protein